ncbi:hypothetical protein IDVR_08560 [Intrasporangium sp. DVR]
MATAALLAGAAIATAGGATAAGTGREPITGHDPFVLVTCAGGAEIIAGVEGYVSNERELIDRETGDVVGAVFNIVYTLSSTLSTTGEVQYAHGTARLHIDFVTGVLTETGNSRTRTVPGEGWVIKNAGRTVSNLWTGEVLWKAGPATPEDAAFHCGLFGLEA